MHRIKTLPQNTKLHVPFYETNSTPTSTSSEQKQHPVMIRFKIVRCLRNNTSGTRHGHMYGKIVQGLESTCGWSIQGRMIEVFKY
jgi:hypothetical protein